MSLLCRRSNASKNARLIGRVTEIPFDIQNTAQKRKLSRNSKIQETDPLVSLRFSM